MRRILMVASALLLAACALTSVVGAQVGGAGVEIDLDALVEDGRVIAEAGCARCHGVGEFGESPNSAAPLFRTLLSRYRADVLEEELVNGIRVAHPMPEFQFSPQGVDALMAYLRSVQESPTTAAQ
jgi:mono/diheme cytochrome c family protein